MGKRKRRGGPRTSSVEALDLLESDPLVRDPLIGQTFFFDAEPQDDVAPRGGLGSQCLPVSEPDDIGGDREDDQGIYYLGQVRKEAAALLDIKSIAQLYPTPPPSAIYSMVPPPRPQLKRPDDEWRLGFEKSFKRMRETIRQAGDSPALPALSYLPTPDTHDEQGWHAYIYGTKQRAVPVELESIAPPTPETDEENGHEMEVLERARREPKEPDAALINTLDQSTILGLIEHFESWIQDRLSKAQMVPATSFLPPSLRKRSGPTAASKSSQATASHSVAFRGRDAQWLFALLAALDDLLAGEEIDRLRRLARTCLAVLAAEPTVIADEDAKAGCWIVVAAVAGVWGQRDLWQET